MYRNDIRYLDVFSSVQMRRSAADQNKPKSSSHRLRPMNGKPMPRSRPTSSRRYALEVKIEEILRDVRSDVEQRDQDRERCGECIGPGKSELRPRPNGGQAPSTACTIEPREYLLRVRPEPAAENEYEDRKQRERAVYV